MPIFHDQIDDRCFQHFPEFGAFYWLKNADFSWGIAQGHHKMDTRSFWYNVKFCPKKNNRWPFGWDMYCLMSSINLVSSSVNISLSHPDISRVHGTSYPGSSGSHISIAFLLRYLLIRNWFQHHSRQEPWRSLNLPANELNCSIPVHKCINKPNKMNLWCTHKWRKYLLLRGLCFSLLLLHLYSLTLVEHM